MRSEISGFMGRRKLKFAIKTAMEGPLESQSDKGWTSSVEVFIYY